MVSFADAIRNAFVGYAQFSGRSTRAEYWWFVLFNLLVGLAASIIDSVIFGNQGVISLLTWLVLLVPNIAVSVRRVHDIDKSGWWVLWNFLAWFVFIIPGLIMWLILWTRQGDNGSNRYGFDPRGDSEEIDYGGEVTETSDEGPAVGTTDELNCPTCSVGNKPNSKFCKQCGVSLDNAT